MMFRETVNHTFSRMQGRGTIRIMKSGIYTGGAPVIGDSPALDLVNTLHTPRGIERDGIAAASDLADWIRVVTPRLGSTGSVGAVGDAEVARFRELRATVRSLVASVAVGELPASTDVDRVNQASELAPSWPGLRIESGVLKQTSESSASGTDLVLASLAKEAVELLTSERANTLRACEAHNCSLYFLKNHPRREWCSESCGARVRAARAYARRTASPVK